MVDQRRARPVALAALAAAVTLWAAPAAVAEERAFVLAGGVVTHPAGMATDHLNQRYWALQSSSGTLSVQAFDATGARLGAVSSRDRITNVQALAFSSQQLFIGDIGGSREKVTILQMDRPLPGTEINKSMQISLAYPDGAHDAAAIMADASARLYVVTKGPKAGIYAAPAVVSVLPAWATTPAVANKMTRVADAPADVTDATMLVDGRIALRSTAGGVTVLDAATYQTLGTQPIAAVQKGGSLTQSLDKATLLGAAGTEGSVVAVGIPGPAPAQPTATSTKKPTESQPQVTQPEENKSYEQTGTMVALVAAVGAALLASAVVLLKR